MWTIRLVQLFLSVDWKMITLNLYALNHSKPNKIHEFVFDPNPSSRPPLSRSPLDPCSFSISEIADSSTVGEIADSSVVCSVILDQWSRRETLNRSNRRSPALPWSLRSVRFFVWFSCLGFFRSEVLWLVVLFFGFWFIEIVCFMF